jgi:PPM family protein phosphatase
MKGPVTHITFYGMSDTGLRRPHNEDHFVVVDLTQKVFAVRNNTALPHSLSQHVGRHGTLLAVADGVGGYAGGELASQIAVEAMAEALWSLVDADPTATSLLGTAMEEAHDSIRRAAERHTHYPNMASTLTALHITADGRLIVGQIGDSRAYLWRDRQLIALTEDQTIVQYLQKSGLLNECEIARHPYRHIILQALGQDHPVQPDVRTYRCQDGDRLLLCTDGLSSYVHPGRLEVIMAQADDEYTTCQALIQEANAHGGPDNITVLVASLAVCTVP